MNRITRVAMTDFGPHAGTKEFVFDSPGAVAITGANGKGKSHFIDAVMLAMNLKTNKPLAWYVHGYGLKDVTKATVELDMLVDGEELNIHRTISLKKMTPDEIRGKISSGGQPDVTGRFKLTYRDNTISKAEDVKNQLEALFSMGDAMRDSVFVLQGQAGRILSQQDSERAKVFQQFSGAELCAKAYSYAGAQRENYRVVDVSGKLKQEEDRLNDLLVSRSAITEGLRGLMEQRVSAERRAEVEQQLQELQGVVRRRERDSELHTKLLSLVSDTQRESDTLEKTVQDLRAVDGRIAEHVSEAEQVRGRLASREAYHKGHTSYLSVKSKLDDANAAIAAAQAVVLHEPELPENLVDEISEELVSMRRELASAESVIKTLGTGGVCPVCENSGTCPSCGNGVGKPVAALVAGATASSSSLRPQIAEFDKNMRDLKLAWSNYRSMRLKLESDRKAVESAKEMLEAQVAQLESFAAPPAPTDEDVEYLARFRELEVFKRTKEHEKINLENTLKYYAETCAGLKVELDKLVEEGIELAAPVTEGVLKDELTRGETVEREIARREGELKSVDDAIRWQQAVVDRINSELGQLAKKIAVGDFLDQLRGIMHPNCIPHDRAVRYIGRLNRHLEEQASYLGLPIKVFVDPETQQFMFNKNDLVAPAHQLSGGERTMAAWAWHLALYEMHGARAGFMLMDEPTVGLDDTNLANVARVSRRLTGRCAESGRQLFLITHDPELSSSFDRVERL